jgi:hypothetical protein
MMQKTCFNCGCHYYASRSDQLFCSKKCRYKYYHNQPLTLTLMSKWFDMILFEGKLEEYRIIKPYWTKRFKNYFGEYYDFSVEPPVPVWNQIKKDVVFKNGYRKDARQFTAECSISEGTGREEWGAVPGEKYYILTIHRIFDTKNCSLLKYLK